MKRIRPAPDLDIRREQITNGAYGLAEAEGWPAVTMRREAYLDFSVSHPRIYEAMFSLPSELQFGPGNEREPLRRAFRAIQEASPVQTKLRQRLCGP